MHRKLRILVKFTEEILNGKTSIFVQQYFIGSNYDYHFLVKYLVEKFDDQFEYLEQSKRKQSKEKMKTARQ